MNDKILFLGDVFLRKNYSVKLPTGYPFVLNLEGPISKEGVPIEGKINIIMRERLLDKVFSPLPSAVSLANNHIMDYGNEAFEDTIGYLKKLGIRYFGAGSRENNFNNPLVISVGDVKVGLLGYCYAHYYDQIKQVKGLKYGPAPLNMVQIKDDIFHLKQKADRIVLNFHWGMPHSNIPKTSDIEIARKCVDLGAHCIIGHHSHTVQPIERYNNSIIAYGLGNYIFEDIEIPSYYDTSGVPNRFTRVKQRIWNRSSIGLIVKLSSLEYSIVNFIQESNSVKIKKSIFHRFATFKIQKRLKNMNTLIDLDKTMKRIINKMYRFIDKFKE